MFFVTMFFSLYTDIAFGNKFGFATACVLSGVTNKSDIDRVTSSVREDDKLLKPSYVFSSVDEIYSMLQPGK